MKMGTRWGVLFAATLSLFGAEPADATATAAATEHTNKLSGLFEQLLKAAITNLTQSNTNLGASTNTTLGTNIVSNPTNSSSLASISAAELSDGVKQAIAAGLARAVASLGRTNGFLTNAAVKIQLPAQLAKTDKMLRKVGQGPLVDQFVDTMNHAAEQAVPIATGVFAQSLTQLTIADARNLLLSKSKTAATEFFRRTTTNELSEKFLPIVRDATQQTGVTAAYKNLMAKAPFGAALFGGGSNLDVDKYVTAKALDGLFTLVAEEEIRIRENPQARATDLLQKIFGALPQISTPQRR